MKIFLAEVHRNPIKWTVLGIFQLFAFYFIYQDMKMSVPWYAVAAACVLGTVGGVAVILKVIIPLLFWLDTKTKKLFRIN